MASYAVAVVASGLAEAWNGTSAGTLVVVVALLSSHLGMLYLSHRLHATTPVTTTGMVIGYDPDPEPWASAAAPCPTISPLNWRPRQPRHHGDHGNMGIDDQPPELVDGHGHARAPVHMMLCTTVITRRTKVHTNVKCSTVARDGVCLTLLQCKECAKRDKKME